MAVVAKICGVRTREALDAAIAGRARYVGFVCYPPSPRHIAFHDLEELVAEVPAHIIRVGLFVDPDDDTLGEYVEEGALDMLQLQGSETPRRIAKIKEATGLPVMKAVHVASREDVEAAIETYAGSADRLMFEPTPAAANALPGGNGLPFDWRALQDVKVPLPWMLAGGLTAANVADAVHASGAKAVDVSSGVESSRGVKSPDMIRAFLSAVARL
ncbi:MAG: phosphoribosylanthranilate isomerase [Alphaproteobacteria bacterium]|nr:phosphoribosylanthranilate isomerase [Alphaproteobacteria bacterium]MCW5740852.1 phosphoribosylanthranilate isomerase [Alphaproteobacteria bacterium]